jgi:hypothetical protein
MTEILTSHQSVVLISSTVRENVDGNFVRMFHPQCRSEQSERKRESNQNGPGHVTLTFGQQRGLVDDGVRAHGSGLRRGEAGRPALEHARAPGVPDGGELHDAGPEQHRGGGAHHPELHPRARGDGGGRGEPEPVAAEAGLMRFPHHQSWTDAGPRLRKKGICAGEVRPEPRALGTTQKSLPLRCSFLPNIQKGACSLPGRPFLKAPAPSPPPSIDRTAGQDRARARR